ILDVNRSACEKYGYSRSEFIVLTLDTITKDAGKRKTSFQDMFNKGLKLQFETIQYNKEGEEIYFEVNAAPVSYKGQRAIVSVNRDITERKKAEEALRESEKRYQDLYDSAPEMYFSISEDGKIKSVNKTGALYLGYTKEELNGSYIWKLIYDEDSRFVIEQIRRIFRDKVPESELEFRRIRKDNKTLHVLERTRLVFDENNNPVELFITSRDVTERKQAEEAFKDTSQKMETLIEATTDAVLFKDGEGRWLLINSAAADLLGLENTDYTGKTDAELAELSPYSRNALLTFSQTDYRAWENKKATVNEETLQTKDGARVILETIKVPVYNSDGSRKGLVIVGRDVTARKEAETAISQSEEKYRNLAKNAPVAVTRVRAHDNRYEFVNDEFVRQSGYTMEEYNELSNEQLIEMIHPDDRDKLFLFYKKWKETGHRGTKHIDYRIINKRNETVWLDTYLYADFDSSGQVAAINQVCIDITGQKQAQETINASESRFRALIENSSDLIALVDSKGTIIYASPSTTRILGYQLDEYIGRSGFDFVHPDDVKHTTELLNELVQKPGGSVSTQYRSRHKDGHWLWIEATGKNLLEDSSVGAIVVNYRDISERKHSEEEILLQKSYFQQLFENSPEGIVILDKNDKILDANKGFEKMFQHSVNEIKGKNINDIIIPEDLSEQALQMSLFALKGEIIHKEIVRKRKDGSLVDVSILAYPIIQNNDQIGVYGIYSDISQRKEAEKALTNSEERYRAFVEQSTEGIARIEFLEPISVRLSEEKQIKQIFKFGYLAECNDLLANMYGYNSADEIVGQRLQDLLPQSDPLNVEYIRKSIRSNYRINNAESFEADKEGNPKYFLNNFVGIVENGYLKRVWGSQRDITETKLAEQELYKTQLRLATLLSNLPDVVLYETGSEREFISENVIGLLGYPASTFMSDRKFFPSLIHPEDFKVTSKKLDQWHKANEHGILNLEFRCRRSDGTYIWLEDHMVSIKPSDGRHHMAGVLVDITNRKKSEEKLKHLAEKLSISNKELEQFAYVASHDLQEPLRMVASYIQLLQRRYKGQIGKEADEFIGFAVDGVTRMKSLINDLLIYSRVNTLQLPLEQTDCNKVIEKVLDTMKTSINEKKAKVVYDNLPTIMGNPVQLGQLFQNLISNAVKFRGKETPRVEIQAKLEGEEWQFSVKDNGIGIDKEFMDRIFIIFQRLHNYKEYPGTGIGLAICKKIVERHGGRIWVESELDKGSTIYFTIPSSMVSSAEDTDNDSQ
ncbi:MAG: PAS domain S-box protein, partial [Ignavibacteria bacterium]